MLKNSIHNCNILDLPKIHNLAGNISFIENNHHIPFDVKRVYFLYDIPGGASRGGHAHKELHQLIVAVSGAFDVQLDDSFNKKVVTLNRPDFGLLIVPGIWRELLNFSSGAICLVMASTVYNELDYIRGYEDYLKYKKMS